MTLPDLLDHVRRPAAGRHVDDGGAGLDFLVNSSSQVRTVAMTGVFVMRATSYTVEGGAGALSTTPAAPCISAIMASWMTRGPVVVPPPTPTNSGARAAVSRAQVMTGSPVNGYTARMASALVLRMMAASVVNANEWSWRPRR